MSPASVLVVAAVSVACWVSAGLGVSLLPTATGDAVRTCQQNGNASELNQCIAKGIDHFLKAAKNGLTDIGLDPIDPLVVKHIRMDQGSGKVTVSFEFQEVRIKGFSASKVHSVRMNVNDKKLEVSLTAPVYEIDGFYSCNGGIYELPLSSSGRFTITMTDVTSAWMLYYQTKRAGNETLVAASRFIVDVSPANIAYRFDKKFDGENSLGEAMNEFMNDNALEIYNDVKPKLMKTFGELFLDITNRVLMNYPKALDISKK